VGVVLLDTSAVIAFLQSDDAFHASASTIISAHVGARSRLAISVVTVTELFTGAALGHQEERVVNGFLEDFGVLRLPVEEAIARRAAQIRGVHTGAAQEDVARPIVRVPDALILATADLSTDIEIVVGGDKRWKQAAEALDVLFVYLGGTPEPEATLSGKRGGVEKAIRPTETDVRPMYRRLPHGPHGMGREAVARHQRARMFGAMIEAVYRNGYQGTTVAHVIALAGVSRHTFWEQFANKEDCFLGTYDIVTARAKKLMMEGWMSERGWANRVFRAAQALFEDAQRNVKSTRLVLIDGLGLGPRGLERMARSSLAFERVLADGFRVAPDGVQLPPLAPKAIVGGARYVMLDRLLSKREAELPMLADEMLDWISAYRSPAARIGAIRARPSHLPAQPLRFLMGEDERARVLGATVHLILDMGYGELTDAQIAQFAGMSTRSFHQQFANKQECFLAAVDAFVNETLDVIVAAASGGDSWSEAVYLGVKAGVEHLTSHPGATRVSLIDVFETGPAVSDSVSRSLRKLSGLLAKDAPVPRRAPLIAHDAIAGAVWAVALAYARPPRLKYLPSLTDELACVVLAPYVGPKAAAQTIETMRRPDNP
jgi:AcrR family transcriptional regulator/predicted nucleic acid-binding protein